MAKKYSLPTAAFCAIWRNHVNHDHKSVDDWNRFVLNVYERFSVDTNAGNVAALKEADPKWKSWNDTQKFEFLSPKCYSKCITIRRKVKKDEGYVIPMPNGYKSGSSTARLSSGEIADIFRKPQK